MSATRSRTWPIRLSIIVAKRGRLISLASRKPRHPTGISVRLPSRGFFGRFDFDCGAAGPWMLRDIEHDAVRPAEFDFEMVIARTFRRAHEAFGAHRFEPRGPCLDVVNQQAEMMQPGVVEALAELVRPAELQHRHVGGAVTEEVAMRQLARDLAHLLEAECALVELRGGVGILRRDRDVANRGAGGAADRPRMRRDIEDGAVGSVELDLDVTAGRILVRLEEAFGAE